MKHLKKFILIVTLFIFSIVRADEGMWLPLLLEKLNEKHMKSLGMKISARDIYNINAGSLKDAIVSFGGFCTGEVISGKGLVLTNHHCGFGAIQSHSTIENNYIRDGFWAANYGQEIPNPNLFVTFIVRIDDVSKQVLSGVNKNMSESERQSAIDKNINELRKNVKKEIYQDVLVRPFFEGNQYYLFVTETYRDIRLVGAPPSSIGNFGKDTDNWMWPRHTGDFALFRIYAGRDNKPAAYSPENVPYTPKKFLSISLSGVKEGDFTMVFGFPGRTMQYIPGAAVEQILHVNNPVKIAIRDKALAVMDAFMRKDEKIKIQYASKYAGISNSWKKWQGENLGLKKTDALEKKAKYEAEFMKRVSANPQWKEAYGTVLQELNEAYAELKPYGRARDYYTEIVSRIELFSVAGQLNSLVNAMERDGERGYQQRLIIVKETLENLFKDFNAEVDKKLFETLLDIYVSEQEKRYVSSLLLQKLNDASGSFSKLTENVYNGTDIFHEKTILALLDKSSGEVIGKIKGDAAVSLFLDMQKTYQTEVQGKLNEVQGRINRLQRTYMQAQLDVFPEKIFYPDANSTMRVTYGQVKGYQPRDAVEYDYYTWLDGVMEKYIPGDYEFDVPEKLRELHRKKDYGIYGVNGRMPVCFIAANHTTGGNSGSPALDAYSHLIGINFDRVWEGTMSDIHYDPSICRNIMVDIRYILFIIDKYAGAGHLVKEMKLVKTPAGKK